MFPKTCSTRVATFWYHTTLHLAAYCNRVHKLLQHVHNNVAVCRVEMLDAFVWASTPRRRGVSSRSTQASSNPPSSHPHRFNYAIKCLKLFFLLPSEKDYIVSKMKQNQIKHVYFSFLKLLKVTTTRNKKCSWWVQRCELSTRAFHNHTRLSESHEQSCELSGSDISAPVLCSRKSSSFPQILLVSHKKTAHLWCLQLDCGDIEPASFLPENKRVICTAV